MKPVFGSLTMTVAFTGEYFFAITSSSSSAMCWMLPSMDRVTE